MYVHNITFNKVPVGVVAPVKMYGHMAYYGILWTFCDYSVYDATLIDVHDFYRIALRWSLCFFRAGRRCSHNTYNGHQ